MDYLLLPGVTMGVVALALALQTAPVWFAAKIVGAGKSDFFHVCASTLIAGPISIALLFAFGLKGLLIAPFVFWLAFKVMLETSFLGAFIVCVLGMSFHFAMAKAWRFLLL
ncbi:MAG: hypothetical protein EOP38_14675 [Rubrivivax sp.]|nr:MAG: hypothetical protein EOP38_14675 [Rubrivivax sp.]